MNERQIIVGLLRLVRSVADQQAMPDDSWRQDIAYKEALTLPITLSACRSRGSLSLELIGRRNFTQWEEAGCPWPICCHCQRETQVPTDMKSIAEHGLCGTCRLDFVNGKIQVME